MRFEKYVVVPLKDLGETTQECEERNADFWGLFGISYEGDAYAIGDFSEKSDAELIKGAIEAPS